MENNEKMTARALASTSDFHRTFNLKKGCVYRDVRLNEDYPFLFKVIDRDMHGMLMSESFDRNYFEILHPEKEKAKEPTKEPTIEDMITSTVAAQIKIEKQNLSKIINLELKGTGEHAGSYSLMKAFQKWINN